jgi:BirA family biotin operon repressor/biotin-[acetyl-CoA-carboxylase] ligase
MSVRFGSPRKNLSVTGSTNEDALTWAEEDAPEGACVVAEQQTEGRGRRGRTWLSEPGHSLLFSIVLRPPTGGLPLLSTAIGVGACEALRNVTKLSVMLKWPNDLVVDDRKLAGILVETRSSSDGVIAAAGLGLNLSWPGDAPPTEIAESATSISAELRRYALDDLPAGEDLLRYLLSGIERRYAQLVRGDPSDIVTTAESLSSLVGREVSVQLAGGETVSGMVTGLSRDGGLEVVAEQGQRVFVTGEVVGVRRRRANPGGPAPAN